MHAPLAPNEILLNGSWVFEKGEMRGDVAEDRIGWLITKQLVQIAIHPESGVWEILYRDPSDGRLWELTYPQGGMQGGGPKRLQVIGGEVAGAKYQVDLA